MTSIPQVELVPRKVLFGNPVKTNPRISPDGTRFAYLAPINDVLNVWVGPVGGDAFEPVTQDSDRGVRFYFWAADNTHILYIQDIGGNENWRLYATNLETKETRDLTPFENVLAADSQYDVGNVMLHPDTYEVQAVVFNRDRTEWSVLDKTIQVDFDCIRAIHQGDFFISSRDDADTTWIVTFTVDNGPIPFYIYERKGQRATFLFDNQPALSQYTLAHTQPITFTSRDGLTIHGYLTLPIGVAPEKLPMVLHVHGGPWTRDAWGYNPVVQWLVNRGYACLQVNYRGSTGYGKQFLNAGNKEWGAKMHDDLVDAVHWAIQQGIADPKRVAIYGGSYGGYAALVGATFTPDLFCCAVDIVGPSNLITLIKTIPPYWATVVAQFLQRVGNPDSEEEFLKSRSPLFKVDQIRIPLLIAQGANDPRVKQAESEQIVEAMKGKGIKYEYLLFPDEGHGSAKPENRLKFYAAAEKFLTTYLGGRYEE